MADDAEGTVRILAAADLTAFRSVRLEALRLAPQAFLPSLDEELALLLDLEQSYKASAKLVAAVDEMIAALLQAAG